MSKISFEFLIVKKQSVSLDSKYRILFQSYSENYQQMIIFLYKKKYKKPKLFIYLRTNIKLKVDPK